LSINSLTPAVYKKITGNELPYEMITNNASMLKDVEIEINANAVILYPYNTTEKEVKSLIDFSHKYNILPEFLFFMIKNHSQFQTLKKSLTLFRQIMKNLGYKSSFSPRLYTNPKTLYTLGNKRVILRDYAQFINQGYCQNCFAQNFCTEGVCHVRLLPDGKIMGCRYGESMKTDLINDVKLRNEVDIRNKVKNLQNNFGKELYWYKL